MTDTQEKQTAPKKIFVKYDIPAGKFYAYQQIDHKDNWDIDMILVDGTLGHVKHEERYSGLFKPEQYRFNNEEDLVKAMNLAGATITLEEVKEKIKQQFLQTVDIRNQMGGALYWNITNDEACKLASIVLRHGTMTYEQIATAIGPGNFFN